MRVGGKVLETIKHVDIEVDVTEKQLYDDWNKFEENYGRIPFNPDITTTP